MTVNNKDIIDFLIKEFPVIKNYWKIFKEEWKRMYAEEEWEDVGATVKITPFSEYTVDVIKSGNEIEIKRIFDMIEYLINQGDISVQAAMTTIVLEDLLELDPKEIQFKKFAHHLGKESVEYCKYWNKFCGCKTEGIDY